MKSFIQHRSEQLNETIASQRGIEKLAKYMVKKIVSQTWKHIRPNIGKPIDEWNDALLLSFHKIETPSIPTSAITPVLEDFYLNSDITISYQLGNGHTRGIYNTALHTGTGVMEHTIELFLEMDHWSNLQTTIINNNNPRKALLYFVNLRYGTLVHELQHAYDDYISDGHYSSEGKKNRNAALAGDFASIKTKNLSDDEYLLQPHEINARYSQTVAKINIKNDKVDMRGKRGWDDYKFDFKLMFGGWYVMTPDIQKRLIKRLSSEWHSLTPDQTKQVKADGIMTAIWDGVFGDKPNYRKIDKQDSRVQTNTKKDTPALLKKMAKKRISHSDLHTSYLGTKNALEELFKMNSYLVFFAKTFGLEMEELLTIKEYYF